MRLHALNISFILSAEDALEFAALCEMAEGSRRTAALAAWVQGLYLWAQRAAVNRSRLRAGAKEPELQAALSPLLALVKKGARKPTPRQVEGWLKAVLP